MSRYLAWDDISLERSLVRGNGVWIFRPRCDFNSSIKIFLESMHEKLGVRDDIFREISLEMIFLKSLCQDGISWEIWHSRRNLSKEMRLVRGPKRYFSRDARDDISQEVSLDICCSRRYLSRDLVRDERGLHPAVLILRGPMAMERWPRKVLQRFHLRRLRFRRRSEARKISTETVALMQGALNGTQTKFWCLFGFLVPEIYCRVVK